MQPTPPIRIIIADDHPIVRKGFKLLLNSEEFMLCAVVANGEELLKEVEAHNPHVIITDISMPVMDGIEATRRIKSRYPSIKVITISLHDDTITIKNVIEAGTDAFLLKTAEKGELLKAIHTVLTNRTYFTPEISDKLTSIINRKADNTGQFTTREREIIRLICFQFTSREIAEQLFICERTVEDHKYHMRKKIGAKGIAGIITYAISNGIVNLEEFQ